VPTVAEPPAVVPNVPAAPSLPLAPAPVTTTPAAEAPAGTPLATVAGVRLIDSASGAGRPASPAWGSTRAPAS
jgi:hypothetical protein